MNPKPPTTLELLADALVAQQTLKEKTYQVDLVNKLGPVMGFQRSIARALLRQAFAHDPQATAMPDGRSILVACARTDPDLAVYWRQLRGPGAWEGTTKDRYPLAGALNFSNNHQVRYFEMADKKAMLEFIRDGLEHAMPLHQQTAITWAGKKLTENQKTCLWAQERVANAIQAYAGSTEVCDAKVQAFLDAGAAIPAKSQMAAQHGDEMVVSGKMHPATPMIGAVDPKTHDWLPWWKTWISHSEISQPQEILNVLVREGIATEAIKQQIAAKQGMAALRALRHSTTGDTAFREIQAVHATYSPQEFLLSDPQLVWHAALHDHPAMLSHMLAANQVEHSFLSARAPGGHGIWDAIGKSIWQGGKYSATALAQLKKQVDPDLSHGGLLWLAWTVRSAAGVSKALELARNHPHFLLGDVKQQRQGMIALLSGALGRSVSIDDIALARINALFDPTVSVAHLCAEVRLGMHALRDFLLEHPKRREIVAKAPNLVGELLFDPPTQVNADWVRRAKKALAECDDANPQLLGALTAGMDRAFLASAHNAKPVAIPRPRARL